MQQRSRDTTSRRITRTLHVFTVGLGAVTLAVALWLVARDEILWGVAACFIGMVPIAVMTVLTPKQESPVDPARQRARLLTAARAIIAAGGAMTVAAVALAIWAPSPLVALFAAMGPGALLGGWSVLASVREDTRAQK